MVDWRAELRGERLVPRSLVVEPVHSLDVDLSGHHCNFASHFLVCFAGEDRVVSLLSLGKLVAILLPHWLFFIYCCFTSYYEKLA